MIIETLYLELKAQTDELQRDLQDVTQRLNKTESSLLSTARATDKADSGFTKLAHSINSVKSAFLGSAAIVFGTSLLTSTAQATNEILSISTALGLSVEQTSALVEQVKRFGGSAQDVLIDFQSVSRDIFAKTGQNISFESLFEKLPELAELFETLGPEAASRHLEEIGIGPEFIKFLAQGKDAVAEITENYKRYSTVSKEQALAIRESYGSLRDFFNSIEKIANAVLVKLTPAIKFLTEQFKTLFDWLDKHPAIFEALVYGILGITAALVALGIAATVAGSIFLVGTPLGWGILAITALVVAGTAAWVKWGDQIKIWVDKSSEFIDNFVSSTGDQIKIWLDKFSDFIDTFVSFTYEKLDILHDKIAGIFEFNVPKWFQDLLGNGSDINFGPGFTSRIPGGIAKRDSIRNLPNLPQLPFSPLSLNTTSAYQPPAFNVSMGDININSNADATQALANDIVSQSFPTALRQAMANVDDGVAY